MSFMEPGRREVAQEMMALAKLLKRKAEELTEFAESVYDEVTDEQFMEHLGDRYTGAQMFRSYSERMAKAAEVRPSDTAGFERAMSEAFARAQRDSAAQSVMEA